MVIYLALILILGSWLTTVKIQEKRLAKNRARTREIVEKMLSQQIEILSGGEYDRVSLELEISKFIKDCLIINLENGGCDARDIWKAYGWQKQEFKEFWNRFYEKTDVKIEHEDIS